MANYLHQEECPKCHIQGRKKTLARYDDGSAYCFYPCGYYALPTARHRIASRTSDKPLEIPLTLPEDITSEIAQEGLEWLQSYGITHNEIWRNRIAWSPSQYCLIFPYYIDGHLVAYQKRNFVRKPKWFSQGNLKRIIYILSPEKAMKKGIVLVEDIISAIKCSRHLSAVPLFGSEFRSEFLVRLSSMDPACVTLWLDYDKRKEAVRGYSKLRIFFKASKVIVTEKDPKEYDDKYIEEKLKS